LKDLVVDGNLIIRWLLKKWDGGMDCIDLAQDSDRWWSVVNGIYYLAEDLFVSFSERTLVHGVN
jgi:hypothetical protein